MGIQKPVEARIRERTVRDQLGCIVWEGPTEDGYARAWVDGGMRRLHRIVWELHYGDIPADLVVDHTCHQRACLNIEHLRLVPFAVNCQNRAGPPRHSTTGVRGVRLHPNGKYQVRVAAFGRRHHGGYFSTLEEAARRADEMRAQLHPTSSPMERVIG